MEQLKTYYSAAELAAMHLTGYPVTKKGWLQLIAREDWISRPREGRGGGMEYVPSDVVMALIRNGAVQNLFTQSEKLPVPTSLQVIPDILSGQEIPVATYCYTNAMRADVARNMRSEFKDKTMLDKKMLAKIHIAKKELAMDDDAYRAMLQNIGGVSSAKDLTVPKAMLVMRHLESCGFKPKANPKHGKKPAKPTAGKSALMGKIEALLAERGYPWEYLTRAGRSGQSMVQRICKVDALEFATAEGLGKLVAALSYDVARRGKKSA